MRRELFNSFQFILNLTIFHPQTHFVVNRRDAANIAVPLNRASGRGKARRQSMRLAAVIATTRVVVDLASARPVLQRTRAKVDARRANQFFLSEVDLAYVKAVPEKYTASVFRNYMFFSARPASIGGAYRDRHGRGRRDAVDAADVQRACAPTNTSAAYGEIVRSRSPDAEIKPACDEPAGDGGQKARRAEENTYKP